MVSQVGGITPTYPSGVSRHADVRGLTDRTRFLGRATISTSPEVTTNDEITFHADHWGS